MSNIKKFPTRKKSDSGSSTSDNHKGEVVNIDEKINEGIQLRLGKFVREIQELKNKQKKLETYNKVRSKMRGDKKKKKKKKKGKTTSKKT